jgi:hypothetical protein
MPYLECGRGVPSTEGAGFFFKENVVELKEYETRCGWHD